MDGLLLGTQSKKSGHSLSAALAVRSCRSGFTNLLQLPKAVSKELAAWPTLQPTNRTQSGVLLAIAA